MRVSEVKDAIRNYTEENGHAPSIKDIAKAVHSSTTPTYKALCDLKDLGVIEWDSKKARSLKVAGDKTIQVRVVEQDCDLPTAFEWKGNIYSLQKGEPA